jgi:hypothetical protein
MRSNRPARAERTSSRDRSWLGNITSAAVVAAVAAAEDDEGRGAPERDTSHSMPDSPGLRPRVVDDRTAVRRPARELVIVSSCVTRSGAPPDSMRIQICRRPSTGATNATMRPSGDSAGDSLTPTRSVRALE